MEDKKELCGDCVFCHKLKWIDRGEWHYASCCTVLPQTGEKGYDAFVIVVNKNECCEMFAPRDKAVKQ